MGIDTSIPVADERFLHSAGRYEVAKGKRGNERQAVQQCAGGNDSRPFEQSAPVSEDATARETTTQDLSDGPIAQRQ